MGCLLHEDLGGATWIDAVALIPGLMRLRIKFGICVICTLTLNSGASAGAFAGASDTVIGFGLFRNDSTNNPSFVKCVYSDHGRLVHDDFRKVWTV